MPSNNYADGMRDGLRCATSILIRRIGQRQTGLTREAKRDADVMAALADVLAEVAKCMPEPEPPAVEPDEDTEGMWVVVRHRRNTPPDVVGGIYNAIDEARQDAADLQVQDDQAIGEGRSPDYRLYRLEEDE